VSRNSYHHSPYAGSTTRGARWPWVFAALIVVALVAAGTMLAQGRVFDVPLDVPERVPGSGEPAATALAPTTAATIPPTDLALTQIGTPVPTPPAQTELETAGDEGGAAPQTSLTLQEGAPAAPIVATPAPAEPAPDPEAPLRLVEAYAAAWSAGDYDGLYEFLSDEAQVTISRSDFVDRYTAIAAEAGLTNAQVEVTGEPNLQTQVPVRVEFQSSLVGSIIEENVIPLVKQGDSWKVAWAPSLIFRDLGEGCVEFQGQNPERGMILDRNGKPLAVDGTVSQVGIVPGQIEDEASMLRALSQLISVPQDEIKARYADGQPEWFMPVKDLPAELDQTFLNQVAEMPGVVVRKISARVYALGPAAAHITGYLSPVTAEDLEADETGTLQAGEMIGRAGIEAGANDLLSGKPGGKLVVVECEVRGIRATIAERQAVPAKDVVLTIDSDFQLAVDKALTDVEGEEKGSAVVIDPRTGAVLAMVSHPSFDPNGFILGFDDKEAARLGNEALQPLLNRAANAAYPAGSIFKAITTTAALAHLGYTSNTPIDCPASFSLPNSPEVWNDWVVENGLSAQGPLTMHSALVQSCNTAFYQIGVALDDKDSMLLPDTARNFGLGAPTGIPYFPESGGVVPDPEWKLEEIGDYWATGDAINLAIGQGFLLVTPLQMANAYAAIANGGTLLQPYIVDQARDPGGPAQQLGQRTEIGKLPLNQSQIVELQSALRDQTSNTYGVGSARIFADFSYPIAGKTGTAQNESNRAGKPHSWFAAYGPSGDTSTIASVVMIESIGEGVAYAAPATRRIYEQYLQIE
jgi:penicillin-binding protein 2